MATSRMNKLSDPSIFYQKISERYPPGFIGKIPYGVGEVRTHHSKQKPSSHQLTIKNTLIYD